MLRIFTIIILAVSVTCKRPSPVAEPSKDTSVAVIADNFPAGEMIKAAGNGALLLTNFKSLAELKSVIRFEYMDAVAASAIALPKKSQVHLTYRSGGNEVASILKQGVSESDFTRARDGNVWNRLVLGICSPYAVWNKKALVGIEKLGRKRPWVYGKDDVAFYDLAESMVFNIAEDDCMAMSAEDLSEKGYLNTFNHITAQAFMTTLFSENLADFVADVHERQRMPELITGAFTEQQLADLENGPVDNYIDIINNEWGQELGKTLGKKYGINRSTKWSPQLMADYLNDIQRFHSWTFQIGFKPFRPADDHVLAFTRKINQVMQSL